MCLQVYNQTVPFSGRFSVCLNMLTQRFCFIGRYILISCLHIYMFHTVNSGSEMVGAKHVSGKNIYWSTCIGKSKERKIFDFLHCPFEPPAKQHRPVSQLGWILWCMLARPSKGQCRNSKIFPPLLLTVKVDQNIFFPETCYASTISDLEFKV